MKKKRLFFTTIRIAVDAEACNNTVSGACDWFTELLSENSDVFDWAHGTGRKNFPKPKLIDEDSYKEGQLFDGSLKPTVIPTPTCKKCKSDLGTPGAVTREYISHNTENPDSYCTGHYTQSGEFEPDSRPSYPLVSHNLVDGSDTCSTCKQVVG